MYYCIFNAFRSSHFMDGMGGNTSFPTITTIDSGVLRRLSILSYFYPFHISSPEALSFLLPLIPNNRLSGPITDSGNLRAGEGMYYTRHMAPKKSQPGVFCCSEKEGREERKRKSSHHCRAEGMGRERKGAERDNRTHIWQEGEVERSGVSLTWNTRTRSLLRDYVCLFASLLFFSFSFFFSLPMLMIYDDPCFMPTLFFSSMLVFEEPSKRLCVFNRGFVR